MAEENGLPWRALGDVVAAAKAFLNPVLGDEGARARTEWSPLSWRWG
jgi:hypothetical protein